MDYVQKIIDKIDPQYLNEKSRFGAAFHLSEVIDTSLAEVSHYGSVGVDTIRFTFDKKAAQILDLTKPRIAKAWGYAGGEITDATREIGHRAQAAGFNVIRYPSERGVGANLAVFKDFEKLLEPQMVVPTPHKPYF